MKEFLFVCGKRSQSMEFPSILEEVFASFILEPAGNLAS